MRLSVVIPTYNRPHLLARAVRSVEEHLPEAEIVVVDDGSLMPMPVSPGVRYFRQAQNQGPGAARNRGIAQATGEWIICLDDDDTICAGAARTIAGAISGTPDIERYPVLQFRTGGPGLCLPRVTRVRELSRDREGAVAGGSGTTAPWRSRLRLAAYVAWRQARPGGRAADEGVRTAFIRIGGPAGPWMTPSGSLLRILSVEDYLGGAVTGDYTPVLQASVFRTAGLCYPSGRTGSEHELWYRVAERWGIPTWSAAVVEVHHEAGARLCSAAAQIREARSHALSQERTLADFGHLMEGPFRPCRLRHLLGASTYWLVAGERRRSRDSSRTATTQFHSLRAAALYGLSYLPTACARVLLRGYRRLQRV